MKTIRLIRHAESVANVGKKTASPETVGLTDTGREQARELACKIAEQPDLIITSPFIRTLQTAEPLLDKFPDAKQEQWPIQEFTYLSPDKCNDTSMEDRIPLAMEYWERNDPHYCDGDRAESFAFFVYRVADFKNKIQNRAERNIIVFSHYQFIAACKWMNADNPKMTSGDAMADFRQYLFSHNLKNAEIIYIEPNKL